MSRLVAALLVLANAYVAAPQGRRLPRESEPGRRALAGHGALEYGKTSKTRMAAVETAAIGNPESVAGADVVVAADSELNRVIESGMTRSDQEVNMHSGDPVGPGGTHQKRRGPEPAVAGARAAARGRAGRRRGARDLAPARASASAARSERGGGTGASVASRASRFGSNEARRRSSP